MRFYLITPLLLGVVGTCIGGMIIFYQPHPDNSIMIISGGVGTAGGVLFCIFAHIRQMRLPVAPIASASPPIQNIYFVYQTGTHRIEDIPDLSKDNDNVIVV